MRSTDIVQQYIDAFNRHDLAAALALFGSTGSYTDPVAGTRVRGAALAGYMRGLLAALPDLRFEVLRIAGGEDGPVVMEWVLHGTNDGPWNGAPATGRRLALPGVDVVDVDGAGIRHLSAYFDRLLYAEQLGLVAEPGAVAA